VQNHPRATELSLSLRNGLFHSSNELRDELSAAKDEIGLLRAQVEPLI
jgi:hypothetical protein